jgi:uncharacterized protein (DUF427 family)
LEKIEMSNPAPGFASRPDYRVDLLPEKRRVKVVFGGVTIADSNAALRVEETGHDPVHYLPEKDVRLDLMRPTEHHTRCPYKGEASYWTIEVPAENGSVRRSENAVWAYPTPYDEVPGLAGYYAFYTSRVDSVTLS